MSRETLRDNEIKTSHDLSRIALTAREGKIKGLDNGMFITSKVDIRYSNNIGV